MRNPALWATAISASLVACSGTDDPKSTGAHGGEAGSSTTSSAGTSAEAGNAAQAGSGTPGGSSSAGQGGASTSPAGGSAGGLTTTAGASNCTANMPLVAPTPSACPAGAPAGPPASALDIVNGLRAHMGLPCMSLVEAINTSAQKHCDYYQQNTANKSCIANAHEEVDTCAGFVAKSFATRMTEAGYTGSPRSEVMAFSGEPASAIAMWINSVYHRTPLLSPWLAEMGYGMTADCDTIDLGLGPKASDDLTAVYPYPGQVGVPLSFDGSREGPMPPVPPTGWPSASPVHLYVKGFIVTSHDVFVNGTCDGLPHQWLPDKDQYILYPDKPFEKNREYRVVIAGTKGGKPLSFDWTFMTKP